MFFNSIYGLLGCTAWLPCTQHSYHSANSQPKAFYRRFAMLRFKLQTLDRSFCAQKKSNTRKVYSLYVITFVRRNSSIPQFALNLPNPLAFAPPWGKDGSSWIVIELMWMALFRSQQHVFSKPAMQHTVLNIRNDRPFVQRIDWIHIPISTHGAV